MRRPTTVLAVLALLVVTGCGAQTPDAGAPAATEATASATPSVAASAQAAPRPIPVPQLQPVNVPAARKPTRVLIPAIKVDAGLELLGIGAGRTIDVPKDPALAGWLQAGPAPGDPGPAVLAGHVDSKDGPAVFYRLSELKAGEIITVKRGDGTAVAFHVDSVEQFSKTAFPTARVYGPTPVPSLRLITCAGTYDKASGYRDNIVVFASRVAAR
ncbi:class F sortase [Kribbella sp. NPDC056861]|uniref:class F sortase n=1 Tax=Kribbella sp. NPDC056861 TaxID=3154857 RepID=UPI00343AA949